MTIAENEGIISIMRMRKIVLAVIISSILFTGISFSEEVHPLGRIVVTPSRLKGTPGKNSRSIASLDESMLGISCYNSIPDVIGNVGGVDIRRRGPEGVQADINIRGATFEENSVMIDGVKINDPQTGHYNMDLPITILDVERIEVLKGPASSLYGPNSFGGVINIITKKPDTEKVILNAEGGSHDYFSGGLSVSCPVGILKNRFSFEESRSTGYMPETEFNIISLSDSANVKTDYGEYDFFFGYAKKDYGADSFYSNIYNNEEEHTDTRFFKIAGAIEKDALRIEPKLFLKRHRDKFALDRNRPGWQTNYHTTYNYGGEINFAFNNQFFDLAYGFELARDEINSTNIQKHRRTKDGIYGEISPHLFDDLYINIGMREDRFSDFGWEYAPTFGLSYRLFEYLKLRSSIGRAYRIPTFTDLYYVDVANIGNPDLKPETSWSYEAGLDYNVRMLNCSATFFHRDSHNTIDWTRTSSRNPWTVSNIGTINTNGFEFSLSITPGLRNQAFSLGRISLDYTALDQYRKHDYFSKYALDYLKQHISGRLECEILGFKNYWVVNYKKRIGDSGFIVVDTKISKEIVRKGKVALEAFLSASNLFDIDYSEQSDISMPGRWIKSGGRLEF